MPQRFRLLPNYLGACCWYGSGSSLHHNYSPAARSHSSRSRRAT